MANDERILKKIGKLLSQYGVSDEEKSNFIIDLQNLKDDEEEPAEEPTENEEEVETPVDNEEMPKEENGEELPPEENTEPETVEEPAAPSEEEPIAEENAEVPTPQEPEQEQPAEPSVDYQAKYEELQKAIDGMSVRFDSLEEALQQVGVLKPQENPVGVPNQEPASGGNFESSNDDVLKLLNK